MNKRRHLFLCVALATLMWLWLFCHASPSGSQEILADNTSRYVGNGRWDWKVFIKASPQILREILYVEYTLHSTFPNPVRRVDKIGDLSYPFALEINGWGIFEIPIKVVFKNQAVHFLKYMLRFVAPPVEVPLQIRANNTATPAGRGWWNWTVYIEGKAEDVNQIQCVEYTLHPTFPNPVREVCHRGTDPHAFPLSTAGWGTFQIQIRVFLKNGRVQMLTHYLRF